MDLPAVRGMALKVEEVNAGHGIEGRRVEMTLLAANAAHEGLPENTVPGWRALAANREVLGIIGPAIGDNALAVMDTVGEGKVPTINWSGGEMTRSHWYFQFQAGSWPDESDYLAKLIARLGHRRIGVLQAGVVGSHYFRHFKITGDDLGLEVVAHQLADVHATDVVAQMKRIREAEPDCVLFVGMGGPTTAFGRAIKEIGWTVPRFGNIAMLSLPLDPEQLAVNEGIIWVDQYEPRNPVLQRVEHAYRARYGEEPSKSLLVGVGYDMMMLMLDGVRRAPNLSRAGLRDGLELVRNVPCATGGVNPVMGFGPYDHAAIKGPDLLMVRTVRDGQAVTFEELP
jgi:ABC-type branched-subunit amino acid transport system substrate-binding protein